MAKLLRIKDYLKLGLALAEDLLRELDRPIGLDAIARREMYGWVPEEYQPTSRFVAARRLLETGEIEKTIRSGKPYFRLTSKGRESIKRDFPIFSLKKKKWDGIWTMIVFDIPEKQRRVRKILVQKLLDLGFGMLQRSVYISPFDLSADMREFLAGKGLEKWVFVARAKRLLVRNPKKLAVKVWKLDRINKLYRKLIEDWQKGSNLRGKRKEQLMANIKSRYLWILTQDPCLPEELLPSDWLGDKAAKLIAD